MKIDMRQTTALISAIKDPRKAVLEAAAQAQALLVKSWGAGKGGNNTPLRRLSKDYAAQKQASGRNPIPDLSWSGDMQKAMTSKSVDNFTAVITATASGRSGSKKTNLDVLEYNVDRRKNIMTVSKQMRDAAMKVIDKHIKKGLTA